MFYSTHNACDPKDVTAEDQIQIAAIEASLPDIMGIEATPLIVTIEAVANGNAFAMDKSVLQTLEDQITGNLAAAGLIQNQTSSLMPASTLIESTNRVCLVGLYSPHKPRGQRLRVVEVTGIPENTMIRQVTHSAAFKGIELIHKNIAQFVPASAVISSLKNLHPTSTTVNFTAQTRTIARFSKQVAYASKVEYVVTDLETGRGTIKQTLTLSEDGLLNSSNRVAVGLNLREVPKGGNALLAWSLELNDEQPIHIGEASGAGERLNAYFSVEDDGTAMVVYTESEVYADELAASGQQ